MEEITITIDAGGGASVAVKGVKGAGCARLTEEIERALGETKTDVKTSEYHEKEQRGKQTVKHTV